MTGDTTERMPSITTLDQIRYVQGQITELAMHVNRTHSRADQEKIDQLRRSLGELNKQYADECIQAQLNKLYTRQQ